MSRYTLNLTRRVTVRFTEEQFKELEEIAIEERFHISEVVRSLSVGFLRQRRKLTSLAGSRP